MATGAKANPPAPPSGCPGGNNLLLAGGVRCGALQGQVISNEYTVFQGFVFRLQVGTLYLVEQVDFSWFFGDSPTDRY